MANFRAFWPVVLAGIAFLVSPASSAQVPGLPAASFNGAATVTNLVFDAVTKEYNAAVGEMTAEFDFAVTNIGSAPVTIRSVRASCGCTTPKMPSLPWTLEPGASGSFHVTADLRGKFGAFQKSVFMDTTEGPRYVYVKCMIPANPAGVAASPAMDSRTRNMQIAKADPQAIFRADCADCHSKPAMGKMGEQLFTTACAICHESDQRAVMVPDLHALKEAPSAAYWEAWVRHGKPGTMMPGFSTEKNGPLTDQQISSLVAYMMTDFPKRPVHGKTMTVTPATAPSPGAKLPFPPPAQAKRPEIPPTPAPVKSN